MPGELAVAGLGMCTRKAPCPYHPTVTCYACERSRPYREADHEAAQREILAFSKVIRDHSTGHIKRQVDAALVGVAAIIKALDDEKDK